LNAATVNLRINYKLALDVVWMCAANSCVCGVHRCIWRSPRSLLWTWCGCVRLTVAFVECIVAFGGLPVLVKMLRHHVRDLDVRFFFSHVFESVSARNIYRSEGHLPAEHTGFCRPVSSHESVCFIARAPARIRDASLMHGRAFFFFFFF
jgi:hypothetical protein